MFGDEERSHANVTTAASSSKAEQTRIMRPQIGSRPGFGFMFWTLDFLTAIQFRAETENHSDEAHLKCGLPSADSGLQVDLEIALRGVSANVQHPELFSPAAAALQ